MVIVVVITAIVVKIALMNPMRSSPYYRVSLRLVIRESDNYISIFIRGSVEVGKNRKKNGEC